MRFIAALLLLAGALPAAAERVIVPVAEPDWRAVAPRLITGDDSGFYAFSADGMARLDRDGTLLDADPIPLELHFEWIVGAAAGAGVVAVLKTSSDTSHLPPSTLTGLDHDGNVLWKRSANVAVGSMVFDGSAFVILSGEWETGLTLSRFDPAGNFLGAREIRGTRHFSYRAQLARAGDGLVVVWVDYSNLAAPQLVAVFIDANGTTTERRFPMPRSGFNGMAVAASDTDAVVVWTDGSDVFAVRFDRDRLIGGPAAISIDATYAKPATVVWDGQMYRIAWRSGTAGRVNVAGLGAGLEFASFAKFDWPVYEMTTVDPPRFAVAQDRALFTAGGLAIVRAAGEPIRDDAPTRPVLTLRTTDVDAAVAWTGDRYVVVWLRSTPRGPEIHARFVDIHGAPLGPSFLVAAGEINSVPHVAATGNVVLVAWIRDLYPDGMVALRRFDVEGRMIDAAPFMLADADMVDVASDGAEFFLAATWECDVWARRVSERGPILPEFPASVARCTPPPRGFSHALSPALAWDGEAYGLLYYSSAVEFDAAIEIPTPYLARVSRNGSATAPVALGGYGKGASHAPTLAAANGRYFTMANREGPRVVPFDLSIIQQTEEDDPAAGNADDLTWTGNAFLVVTRWALYFYSPSGRRLDATQPFPPHVGHPAAAGNGCGGALIAYEGGEVGATRLMAAVLPCDSGKRRSVR